MGCDDPAPARWKCCKCRKVCTLVDNKQWAALQESSCCRSAFYRMDPAPTCSVCGEDFDDEAGEGTVDEEGTAICESCDAERTAYELRHAHPAPPTTVAEYIRAKGAA
jgi:hypothetical protein